VGAIEALIHGSEQRGEPVNLSLPMAADVARYMNAEVGDPYQNIMSIYWSIPAPTLRGVLDQVRTSLTQLVAELRASMTAGEELPSAEAVNQAVNVALHGKRAKVIVNTAQTAGPGESRVEPSEAKSEEPGFWTASRRVGAFIAGAAGVVAAVFAGIELF
jgi:hypothetical protein